MNTTQLQYFVEIARTGTLSHAARVCGISPAAMSKYLKELQEQEGLSFFSRSNNHYTLTPAGQVYLRYATKILKMKREAITSIRRLNEGSTAYKKRLRVGHTPNRYTLAELYSPFSLRFPDILFQPVEGVDIGQLREMLFNNDIDLALTTAIASDPEEELMRVPLYDIEMVLSVPRVNEIARTSSSILARARKTSLSEFKDYPFVLLSDSTNFGKIAGRMFQEAGFSPAALIFVDNTIFQDRMIRSGSAFGIIPDYLAVPSDDVVYFHLKECQYGLSCFLFPKNKRLTLDEKYLIFLRIQMLSSLAKAHSYNGRSPIYDAILQKFEPEVTTWM